MKKFYKPKLIDLVAAQKYFKEKGLYGMTVEFRYNPAGEIYYDQSSTIYTYVKAFTVYEDEYTIVVELNKVQKVVNIPRAYVKAVHTSNF